MSHTRLGGGEGGGAHARPNGGLSRAHGSRGSMGGGTQRRMRPAISRLISPIYPKLTDHPTTRGRDVIAGLTR